MNVYGRWAFSSAIFSSQWCRYAFSLYKRQYNVSFNGNIFWAKIDSLRPTISEISINYIFSVKMNACTEC